MTEKFTQDAESLRVVEGIIPREVTLQDLDMSVPLRPLRCGQ